MKTLHFIEENDSVLQPLAISFLYSHFIALCTVMLNLNEQYLIFIALKQDPKIRKVFMVTHILPKPAV